MKRSGEAPKRAIDWEALADGRMWRLTRGRHYSGSDRAVVDAARGAAERMGKVVSIARENFGATAGYVWVQFADAEVALGSPCPRCGSTTLTRSHPSFATCPSCAAHLVIQARAEAAGEVFEDEEDQCPPAQSPPTAAGEAVAGTSPAGQDVAYTDGPSTPAKPPLPRVAQQRPQAHFMPDTQDLGRLEFYEGVRLKVDLHPSTVSAFYGYGYARGVKPTFLYVEFFAADGKPHLGDHRVTGIAARPYAAALDPRLLAEWAPFEMRTLDEADNDDLLPVHPYYSLNRATGVHVIPVAEDVEAVRAPLHPAGGTS